MSITAAAMQFEVRRQIVSATAKGGSCQSNSSAANQYLISLIDTSPRGPQSGGTSSNDARRSHASSRIQYSSSLAGCPTPRCKRSTCANSWATVKRSCFDSPFDPRGSSTCHPSPDFRSWPQPFFCRGLSTRTSRAPKPDARRSMLRGPRRVPPAPRAIDCAAFSSARPSNSYHERLTTMCQQYAIGQV